MGVSFSGTPAAVDVAVHFSQHHSPHVTSSSAVAPRHTAPAAYHTTHTTPPPAGRGPRAAACSARQAP